MYLGTGSRGYGTCPPRHAERPRTTLKLEETHCLSALVNQTKERMEDGHEEEYARFGNHMPASETGISEERKEDDDLVGE